MTQYTTSNFGIGPFGQSLFGINTDQFIKANDDLPDIHGPSEKIKTLYTIFVSALIFITAISIFEVIKTIVNNYYAKLALNDSRVHNEQEEIDAITIANQDKLKANLVFAGFCIIIVAIGIYFYLKHNKK